MLTRLHKSVAIVLLTFLLIPAFGLDSRANSLETIQTKIARYLKRPGVRSAQWGIQIMDPATSSVVLEVNPDKTFLPASVLKVLTTSAALEKLGPDFRYRTFYTNGTIDSNGTLHGDLVLVGRGDPNLTDPYGELFEKPAMLELAQEVKSLGISHIQGDIIGDDSYFDSDSPVKGWTALALRSLYGAPINALSVNNNVLWVHAQPTKYNQKVIVGVEPQTSYFKIRNQAKTGSRRARRTIRVQLIRGTNTIVVSGILPANKTASQPVLLERAAEVAADMLQEALQREGITAQGKVYATHYGDVSEDQRKSWKLLAEHQSPPLIRALEIINKKSQNLHAEMLSQDSGR